MGILNVIESGMQNKRLIFGMDPGLTHFKVLSTFCTRLHIQDSTLRLPWSVIDAVHICWRCCETAQRQSSWLDFANIGMKTMTDFSLSHLSGLFSHFTSFYPQLLTTLLTCVCLAQFKVNLFFKVLLRRLNFSLCLFIRFKRVLCQVSHFDRTNFRYFFL